jgi:phosphoserine phosphatase RsbU/P
MASIEELYGTLASTRSDHAGAVHASLIIHAGQIAIEAPAIPAEMTNAELQEFLLASPDLDAVAVVRDNRPIALVNRNVFMEQYGRPFSREVFGKRGCLTFADDAPLIVAHDTPIEVVVRHAVEPSSRVMKDGYICTRHDDYFGVGSGMALVKAMSDLEAEKTRQLLSSIDYASAIQQSSLRNSNREMSACLPSARLTWLPRDVVGGDCYFFRPTRHGMFGAIIDCTGHGVPGAFMTLITLSYLENQVSAGCDEPDPAQILSDLNRYIKRVLGQNAGDRKAGTLLEAKSDDGLDAFLFTLTDGGTTLRYAGARLEMAVVAPDGGEMSFFEGDKMGVGYSDTPDGFVFTLRQAQLPAGYRAFVTTDGIIDQIGGPKQIALGRKRLYKLLDDERRQTPHTFTETLLARFADWQGEQHRRDDVCFFAFTHEA